MNSKKRKRCNIVFRLEVLILLDCQEISKKIYMSSRFKEHHFLKLLCVAFNRPALSQRCIMELLKYTRCNIILDITGNTLSDMEFQELSEVHENALFRIEESVDDYSQMLRF